MAELVDLRALLPPGWQDDPLAAQRRLLAQGPAFRARDEDGLEVVVVTGYASARATMADPRMRHHLSHAAPAFAAAGHPLAQDRIDFGAAHLIHSDPPAHDRLRALVSAAFHPRAVNALAPRVHELSTQLVSALPPNRPVELVSALNQVLPVTVIGELLGVPMVDRNEFRGWCEAAVTPEFLDLGGRMSRDEGKRRAGRRRPRRAGRGDQRPQPARRVRHLRPPARRLRPCDRPPDPASLPGHPRHVRTSPTGLDRQCRHHPRPVRSEDATPDASLVRPCTAATLTDAGDPRR